jgi:hypothetical protein
MKNHMSQTSNTNKTKQPKPEEMFAEDTAVSER